MLGELTAALRRDTDGPAVLAAGRIQATRGELATLADRYAAALHHGHGLGPGDTVGMAVRPGARALAVALALHRLGVRIAVLDPTAGPDVLLARLHVAEPALVLADAAAQAVAGWARPLARRAHLALPPLDRIAPVRTIGRRLPGCAPALGTRSGPVPARGEDDRDAVIVFTSGTTSRPRAVVHTTAGLTAGMRQVLELVRPLPGAPVLGGTFFVIVPALTGGAPVALPARSPRALARQAAQLRPQATYLTPPALRALLGVGGRLCGKVYSGSAPVSRNLLHRVREAGADAAWGVYALTEMFPAAAVEYTEKARYGRRGGDDERPTTVGGGDLLGAPLPGVRARLDPDGQLLLSGPGMAHRYLGEQPFDHVSTGDIARIVDGRIVLAGRAKDMILREAENIYPGLYEPALHVAGVDAAVLVGLPAGDGDERLVAVVEPEPGVDESRVRRSLAPVLARMGAARPDEVVLAAVPTSGRSRKPDRVAAARLAARLLGHRVPT